MKKIFLASLLCLPLLMLIPQAVLAVGQGGTCSTDDDCDGTLACSPNKTCQPGEVQAGGSCTTNDQCSGNETCSPQHTCVAQSTGQQLDAGQVSSQPFIPVSDIPAFQGVSGATSLPTFLNYLYTICIGIAVVIAVLQLARAGITYMLSDSITSKEEARHLISASFLGLILVLSPYIVFSLINPEARSLKINTDGLKLDNVPGSPGPGNPAGTQTTGGTTGGQTSTQVGAPTNLQTTSQTSTSASLSWTAPSGTAPSSYQVLDGSTVVQTTSGTTATLTGLTAGSTHQFSVKSVDAQGLPSAASNVDQVTVTADQGTGTDGSEGAYVASNWSFNRDNGFNTAPFNCWKFGTTAFPVPYEKYTKEQIAGQCEAQYTGGTDEQDYSCVFITPGQAPVVPAAPGAVCDQHQYTCSPYTVGFSGNLCH